MATPRICSVPNCDKECKAKGFCSTHYARHYHGRTMMSPARISQSDADAFIAAAFAMDTDECVTWPWTTNKSGYATHHRTDGNHRHVHRYICKLANGSPPEGKPLATHSCGKGHLACINPKHLQWGSPKSNTDDKRKHGTWFEGERVPVSKLKVVDVIAIRSSAEHPRHLSARFGVSVTTILNIRARTTWKSVA